MSVLYIVGSLKGKIDSACNKNFQAKISREFNKYCSNDNINFIYWVIELNKVFKRDESESIVGKVCYTRQMDKNCYEKDAVLVYEIKIQEEDNVDEIIESLEYDIFNDDDFLNCMTNSTGVCIKLDDEDSNKEKYTSIEYFIKGFLTAYRVPIREL